ncbi:MAG: hypothetical protein AUG44_06805 [Actinobacteria bacterium 13_1_20CM_3_71_11]|nr:MAG: hypothetical protein AUG44_06805 [Actinobacteria bacterium 13_1_20CM_3_71_11]
MDSQAHAGDVPAAALPVWPPPTALGPAGAGGGTYQARTGAAVLPAPPPPPLPQQAPPPEPQRSAEPERVGNPVWPEPNSAPSTSPQYGDWARQQRPQGTVYGGSPPAYDPARNQGVPSGYETSGSLTGHILSQGRPDTDDRSSGGTKAVIIIMVVMGVLVVGGLAAAIAWLSGVFG